MLGIILFCGGVIIGTLAFLEFARWCDRRYGRGY